MALVEQIKINEIFFSIQGESTWVGQPTVFVRTTACNLRCTYCDTKYSYHEGDFYELPALQEKILSYGANYICITGGEPLLQKSSLTLMKNLCDLGLNVSLETSGSKNCVDVDPRVKIILDVKTPDSGAADSFLMENLNTPYNQTEFKFVICSTQDFFWAEKFCHDNNLFKNFVVLYSPSYDQIDAKWLAEKIILEKSSARLQLQLHKYIWSPHARGV